MADRKVFYRENSYEVTPITGIKLVIHGGSRDEYDEKKIKNEERLAINQYDNKTLLEETIKLAGGDDYDAGCYSKRGKIRFEMLQRELNRRLKNWLKQGKKNVYINANK